MLLILDRGWQGVSVDRVWWVKTIISIVKDLAVGGASDTCIIGSTISDGHLWTGQAKEWFLKRGQAVLSVVPRPDAW